MSNWRNSREYRIWRAQVIRRDVRCRICGTIKNRHAHHIMHASYYPEYRFDELNGIVLCRGCHSQFHNNFKRNSRIKCGRMDWLNFLALSRYMKKIGAEYWLPDKITYPENSRLKMFT